MNGVPRHIGIIMDGNRRWAAKHFVARQIGHKTGFDNLSKIINIFKVKKVSMVTVYAFSTENWKRSNDEIKGLMNIIEYGISEFNKKFNYDGVQIKFVGDTSVFSENIQEGLYKIEKSTENYKELILNVALNYGARAEIVFGIKKIFSNMIKNTDTNCLKNKEKCFEDGKFFSHHDLLGFLDSIDEENISKNLYVPDVDLIILTAGRMRLSNFLLWQASYAELWSTNTLWPDFSEKEANEALEFFGGIKRNFGK